jgi:hypothetical protein
MLTALEAARLPEVDGLATAVTSTAPKDPRAQRSNLLTCMRDLSMGSFVMFEV